MHNRKCIVSERRRDTGQRIHVCVFVSPVLILSSTNRRVDSSATYSYSCCICPLEFFIVFRHKNNNNSSGQMRQLYAYVANEYTCHLKPIVDPPSILVVFFIDERSAKGLYAAFILRLYPRFWILFLFMHLELLRSRMWVNINRPTTSRPRKFRKKTVKRAERIIGSKAVEGERVATLPLAHTRAALQSGGENLACYFLFFFFLFFFFFPFPSTWCPRVGKTDIRNSNSILKVSPICWVTLINSWTCLSNPL